MCQLKRFLFGIILLSSFGSTAAVECVPKPDNECYEPEQDVFDQLINVLIPILIIIFFEDENSEHLTEKKKK
ncbi:hypothetical protein GLOIN_2v1471985 [Rhizophagus clarus]|uniref:Uncharacterized protein n=1 Tax=Rhizophagus clarus TaxID=94130 RepID=A0A8H3LJW4_9GLOM|nr:hypothetical protein GLOIN_2v1471985 [Rhizophagus clarus]